MHGVLERRHHAAASPPPSFGADIAAIQAAGGNVIPSFGGYSADTTGTELADSCTSVPAIARVFEQLITTYHVPRIDLDVEADSLSNTAGINRRNEAIALTEAWAAAHHRSIQFSYTLPTFATGLTAPGLAVLQNAVADHARISVVNIMTFDYYYGTAQDMATDTETAGAGLVSQLQSLYPAPARPGSGTWSASPRCPASTTSGRTRRSPRPTRSPCCTGRRARASRCCRSGRCNATTAAARAPRARATAPALAQPTWYFSHVFEPFTR